MGRRRATVGGLAIGLAVGWNVSNVAAIATEFADDCRISLATVGPLSTVIFIATIVLQLPVGRGADRYGPRRVALAGLTLLA